MPRYPLPKDLPETFTVADRKSGTVYNVTHVGYDNGTINQYRYRVTVADPNGDKRLNALMTYDTLTQYYRYTS